MEKDIKIIETWRSYQEKLGTVAFQKVPMPRSWEKDWKTAGSPRFSWGAARVGGICIGPVN